MSQSEIARFRQQQAATEKAARLGLTGLAAVASHESIIARMEQDGEYLLQLFKQGRAEEAYALWQGGILGGGSVADTSASNDRP
jgi:hypothetical protein